MAPLLPNCNWQWYNAWVTHNANEEGFVNGLWNAILASRYDTSTLQYAINPEAYNQPGRMDLLVTRNILQNQTPIGVWQIIYEGKSGLSQDNFPQILLQLLGYAAHLVPGRFVYLIGGRGDQAMFWRYTNNGGGAVVTEGISLNNGNVIFVNAGNATQYDMILNQDPIDLILTYFVNNHP